MAFKWGTTPLNKQSRTVKKIEFLKYEKMAFKWGTNYPLKAN